MFSFLLHLCKLNWSSKCWSVAICLEKALRIEICFTGEATCQNCNTVDGPASWCHHEFLRYAYNRYFRTSPWEGGPPRVRKWGVCGISIDDLITEQPATNYIQNIKTSTSSPWKFVCTRHLHYHWPPPWSSYLQGSFLSLDFWIIYGLFTIVPCRSYYEDYINLMQLLLMNHDRVLKKHIHDISHPCTCCFRSRVNVRFDVYCCIF